VREDGRFAGYVSQENLAELMMLGPDSFIHGKSAKT
jgi:hypothetical protein